MEKKGTNKKAYRVVQPEGKVSFTIEELWEGGIVRGPYGSKEYAIKVEEKFARDNGFIDYLVLQDMAEVKNHSQSTLREITAELGIVNMLVAWRWEI